MRTPAPYMAPLKGRAVTTQRPIIERIIPHIVSGDYAFSEDDPVFRITRTAGLLEVWREATIRYRRYRIAQGGLPDTVEAEYIAHPGTVIHGHWRRATADEEACFLQMNYRDLPPGVRRLRHPRPIGLARKDIPIHLVQIAITHQDLHSLHRGIFEHTVKGILGHGLTIEGGEFLYAPGTIDEVEEALAVIEELMKVLNRLARTNQLPSRKIITQGLAVAAELRRAREPRKVAAREALESLPTLSLEKLIPTIQKAALALGENRLKLARQARALLNYDQLVLATIDRIARGIQEVYEDLMKIESEIKTLVHPRVSGLTHEQVALSAERASEAFARLVLYTPFDPFRKRTFSPQVLRLQSIRRTAVLEGARGLLRSIRTARSHLALYAKTA